MDDHNEERLEESYDEAELSDDEFEELSFDNLLDKVESNDPSLAKLNVRLSALVQNNDDHRNRLGRLATSIGRNTHLKVLVLDAFGVRLGEAQAMSLFRCIACNQSIKRLHFRDCGEYFGNAWRILTPLFKNNQVERIGIARCELSHERIGLLATSLAKFDSLKVFALEVKEFDLTGARQHIPQEAVMQLIQALSGHSRLRKLDLSHTNVGELGKLGCSALADLLSNPNINLRVLDLSKNNLGDAEAVVLSSGVAGNVSLKEINLAWNRSITQAGWQALFYPLSSPSCRLERITLEDNDINDAAAQSLSNALTSNITTLKTLNLKRIRGITLTGWRVLFGSLRSPTCVLENLDLRLNEINDDEMVSLTDALATNMSLKSLNLGSNTGDTGAGWQRFFSTVLTNPSSELEKLDVSGNELNDAAIRVLTNALANNSKLKVLVLNSNYQITNTGWEMFSSVLESPSTALEELYLYHNWNVISDATLTSLMNSLAGNKKLKKFLFCYSDDWQPPVSVFCNADSIMDTFNSNHSLQKVDQRNQERYLPDDLVFMLKINRENSPSQAARLKIIKTHFKEGFATQPFVDMNLNVLPHAMAWMSRDGRVGEVDDHFYSFIKSISPLFENVDRRNNKRKRY